MIITIDGPAGAGKSTVAKALSKRLGVQYLDTGAMYRAVTWKAMELGADLSNEAELRRILDAMRLEMPPDGRVLVDGRDVTKEIRDPEVTRQTFYAARSRLVREKMWQLQRRMSDRGVVAEGRDMGTVVFPNADRKFYLDARPEVRAERRRKQLAESQTPPPIEEILADLRVRDQKDLTRDVAPLARAEDAIYVDTSAMSFDEVVDCLEGKTKEVGPSNG